MIVLSIGLTALCAGILQGVTGFGAGIVMMMILPAFFPLNQAAGVSCAIAVVLSLCMALRYRRHVRWQTVLCPAAVYLVVSGSSICLSAWVDQGVMKRFFGTFLLLLSLYYLLFQAGEPRTLRPAAGLAMIVVSGVCDGLFGIGGPLMVLYFLARTGSKEEYLGSIQTMFLANLVWGTALRVYNGILTAGHCVPIGAGMAGILIGLCVANRVVDRLDAQRMKKAIYLVIGVSGVMNML